MTDTDETFAMWWVLQVGHPPATERERFAFELARKAWTAPTLCPGCFCFFEPHPCETAPVGPDGVHGGVAPSRVPPWGPAVWTDPPPRVQPPLGHASHMRWVFIWGRHGDWCWRSVGSLREIIDSIPHDIIAVYENREDGTLERIGLK